ncbi:tetrathionate respiration histidine kinase TtrS [Providencia alcalifaciens]|uniref:histidine kinase n=3 Tax=Enterobacterales TaxID=91347 RepID=A0AAW9V950_9GAMM|nr:ABC transporter, phosphonate, periplasmic substrate-binding protein [Providencia alcalifaciens F90-2004]EUC95189.1 ABC transporter, phosphonate, periplasmic substrate-binding protein [Providencia alcalifaciens PAL-2]EUD11996.1 ABC transporter, phosphonate, periplasmic substrate-binding protein [Providencia alcalifaciens 205/92]MTB34560.1 PhnD/SsuA/transferrin family substrate-binding protein [Providencia alcalifaciens]MTC17350.1 PhnD/SsuA/transferrin family substrate-binding protein [Provide
MLKKSSMPLYHILLITLLLWCIPAGAAQWTIGVLALRGPNFTQLHWQPLVDTLNQSIPGERFILKPLNLEEMKEAISNRKIDFLLTNPAQFIQLDNRYHLRWLLSLRSDVEPNSTTRNVIGSLILVRSDSDIHDANQLIGKKVGAISTDAFGGYLLGYKVLRDLGYDAEKDFRMQFLGFPADALLYALRDKSLTAAIVPVCLLENMDSEGLIDKHQFRPLIQKESALPCLTSTELYPNWSFAALSEVPDNLVDKVTKVLLSGDAPSMRWGAPASITQVENLLRDVNQHPQQREIWQDIVSWTIQHQITIGIIALVFVLLGINHVWIAFLVRRRSQQLEVAHNRLRQQETNLQKAQRLNILGEMASGFAHELNQPLSAIRNYAQGSILRLKKESESHPLLGAISKIDEQAQRGADIIQNLRLWAGKPGQESPLTLRQHSVKQTINHIWQLLQVEQHFPMARLQLPDSPDVQLLLPDTLLDQLLSNLISNSLQAGANTLTFSFHFAENRFLLVLQDDAGGMPDEQLSQGITPFATTKPEGLGLGLVICQRLIQSQGGDIHIENQRNEDGKDGLRVTLIFNYSG